MELIIFSHYIQKASFRNFCDCESNERYTTETIACSQFETRHQRGQFLAGFASYASGGFPVFFCPEAL